MMSYCAISKIIIFGVRLIVNFNNKLFILHLGKFFYSIQTVKSKPTLYFPLCYNTNYWVNVRYFPGTLLPSTTLQTRLSQTKIKLMTGYRVQPAFNLRLKHPKKVHPWAMCSSEEMN